MLKHIIALIAFSLILISCGEKKNEPGSNTSDKEKYSFDSTDLRTEGIDNSGKPFFIRYKFSKGEKLTYRLTYTVTLPCTLWFLDRRKAKTKRADTVLFIDARHIYRQVDRAHRDWTPAQIGFIANLVRLYRGEAPDLTVGGEETAAKLKEVFGKKPAYADVPGLCRAATIEEIEAQGWSLNPGRYVGVASGEEVSDEDFKSQLETLNEELETLNAQARTLEATIAANVAGIVGA